MPTGLPPSEIKTGCCLPQKPKQEVASLGNQNRLQPLTAVPTGPFIMDKIGIVSGLGDVAWKCFLTLAICYFMINAMVNIYLVLFVIVSTVGWAVVLILLHVFVWSLFNCHISSTFVFNFFWQTGMMPWLLMTWWFNSLRPSDAYMRQLTRPLLVQILACRLVGAKPLSEPTLVYCQLDPWE